MSYITMMAEQDRVSFQTIKQFTVKWGPRAIAAWVGGYYSLGFAYASGLLAAIDRVAIKILKNWVGYTGLGAIMPYFQWYSAWTIRIVAGIAAAALFDLVAMIVRICLEKLKIINPELKLTIKNAEPIPV